MLSVVCDIFAKRVASISVRMKVNVLDKRMTDEKRCLFNCVYMIMIVFRIVCFRSVILEFDDGITMIICGVATVFPPKPSDIKIWQAV